MEHTPGPWWHDTVTLYAGPAGDNEGSIQPLTADVVLRETIANLNLCAAAPDLLDVCEALLDLLDCAEGEMDEIKEMAEEAVRKARGG
jgi:hypothetical protein